MWKHLPVFVEYAKCNKCHTLVRVLRQHRYTPSPQTEYFWEQGVYLEKSMCFRVRVVHFSELMLFSGLFASLIFHPTAEWKQQQCSQDRPSRGSSQLLANFWSGTKERRGKKREMRRIEEEG